MTETIETESAAAAAPPAEDPFGAPMARFYARVAPTLPAQAQRLEAQEDWLLDGGSDPHPGFQRALQELADELQRREQQEPGLLVSEGADYAALTRSLTYTPSRRAFFLLSQASVIEPDLVNRLLEWADSDGRSACPAEAQTLISRVRAVVIGQCYERIFGRSARKRVRRILEGEGKDDGNEDNLF